MASSKTNKKSGDVKSLSKQLSQVSAQAKSLGINNADTRKADSMVRQTEAQGSKKYAGSAFDTEFQANEKVINSMTLKPTGTVKYPEYKDTPVPDYVANNNGLTGGESNITTDGTNLNVEQPKNEFDALSKIYEDYNKSLMGAQEDMTTGADVQKKLEKETQIKQLRQEESDYASQLNTITATRDAQVLSLEGTGRGQTEGFIGGEQSRINREAAIKALPVQAQLAAAQNKVQLAQDHINTWGSILMQDAQNKYNFKKEQFGALKDYLTDVEKLRLNKLEKENDRKFAEKQNNIQQLTAIMSDAAANGQGSLISQIKTLNPETLTPQQLLNLAGQLRKPVSATEAKRDTQFDKDGNLVDMQTGEILSKAGGGQVDERQQTQMNETLTLARELLKDDGELMSGKQSAVGASLAKFVPFGQSLGLQGNRTAFENKVNTLKANLTFENLGALKGPMSDKDLLFLQAIGSSLTTNMSEKEFNKEMTRVVNKVEDRMANPANANGQQGRVILSPDGLEIEIID